MEKIGYNIFWFFIMFLPIFGRLEMFSFFSFNLLVSFLLFILVPFYLKDFYINKLFFACLILFIIMNIFSVYVVNDYNSYLSTLKTFIVPLLIFSISLFYVDDVKKLITFFSVLFYSGIITSVLFIFQMIKVIIELGYKGVGFLGNPNYFGGIIVALIPFLYYRIDNKIGNMKINYVCYFVYSIGIIISFSKTAIVGLLLMMCWFHIRTIKRIFVFIFIFILLLFAFKIFYDSIPNFNNVIMNFNSDSSTNSRKQIYQVAFKIFEHNVFFGVGLGNFPNETYKYSYMYTSYHPGSETHNIFMDVLVENGIVVFFLFLFIILLVPYYVCVNKLSFIINVRKYLILSYFQIIIYTSTHGAGRVFYYLWIYFSLVMIIYSLERRYKNEVA